MSDVTRILNSIEGGDPRATEELLPLVYDELRRLATAKMAHEASGQTLQPTALVHEAYLRLVGSTDQSWENRGHFFAAAAEAMRRILVERARRRNRVKHGAGLQRLNVDDLDVALTADDDRILMVHEALDELVKIDPTSAELIKLRFFAGLPSADAARMLNLSERTAYRTWAFARAWLYDELKRRL